MAGEVQRLRERFRSAGPSTRIGRELVQIGKNDQYVDVSDQLAADLDTGAVSFAILFVVLVLVTDYHVVSADVLALTEHGACAHVISEDGCFARNRARQSGKNVGGNGRQVV